MVGQAAVGGEDTAEVMVEEAMAVVVDSGEDTEAEEGEAVEVDHHPGDQTTGVSSRVRNKFRFVYSEILHDNPRIVVTSCGPCSARNNI